MVAPEEENCKDCGWLTETTFKHEINGKDLYYCNNMKEKSFMEKTKEEFIKCEFFDKTKRF